MYLEVIVQAVVLVVVVVAVLVPYYMGPKELPNLCCRFPYHDYGKMGPKTVF